LQPRLLNDTFELGCVTVIVPPVAVVVIAFPVGVDATAPVTLTAEAPAAAPPAIVKAIDATEPFGIVVVFMP
jgi:hypothetical protein